LLLLLPVFCHPRPKQSNQKFFFITCGLWRKSESSGNFR